MLYIMVFNSTQHPIVIDEEGRVVEPNAWAAVDKEMAQKEIARGRLIVIRHDQMKEAESNPAAIMVKREIERVNNLNPKQVGKPVSVSENQK